ncbi:benzoate/H(+) symporter BenE family transporter [Streptomyces monticola]|uniref:Benzoate/H(+) symporter BenE family transporter n=1 Tax=Streptomyces monticola TaxID=2666263 RepID=A0ABW2JPP1_9ACTN
MTTVDTPGTGTQAAPGDRGQLVKAVTAGLIAAFVGFSSSFAVVLEGLEQVGATRAQAASGLMALSLGMGACGIFLSLRTRMPVSVAWSTPGAALLAGSASVSGGFPAAVGAFLVCGALIVVTGLWRRLGEWVTAIPKPLAGAMLAGILLPLCLAPAKAVQANPAAGLAIVVTWAVVAAFKKLYAMPAAVLVTFVVIIVSSDVPLSGLGPLWPQPTLVTPEFTASALIGIGLPLYLVTMASQNIPGIAVLNANGYEPRPGPLFSWTGAFGLASAPFGGHALNLAAITAALCADEGAGPDPRKRFRAAAVSGAAYLVFGVGAGAAVTFVGAAPPLLIEAVAGLALLGALGTSLLSAMSDAEHREAAAVTLVVTVSGVQFFGISGAFWGLLAGGAVYALGDWRAARRSAGVADSSSGAARTPGSA